MSPLFTDLYEITMAQAYMAEGMDGLAVFETFFRKLPAARKFVVAAGLADVLDFLETLQFGDDDIEFLRDLRVCSDDVLARLRGLRFTGDVWAVPEGTVVFPNEPIVQVVAPIVEAQLVETFVLNQIHVQSVIASKAARIVEAAAGRTVVDFGSRRAHGTDAALKVARAGSLVGLAGTSNVLAARTYGLAAVGTMAHSFVQAFADESAAFEAFARVHPGTTLLVDTYDTLRGVDRIVELAHRLGDRFDVAAIRLDSGDLDALARAARTRLDRAGLDRVRIFASSDLDEHAIARLVAAGAPIDAFGVGTRLAVAPDAPTLDVVYKLVEYEGVGRTKLSTAKTLYPGRKQVFRASEGDVFAGDEIARFDEVLPGQPLLVPVMIAGRRVPTHDGSLAAARRHARAQLAALPPPLRALDDAAAPYPVHPSERLTADLDRLREAHADGAT